MRLLSSVSTGHYWILAALWTLGILVAVLIPPSTLSTVEPTVGLDKAVHFVLFAGFGGLWMRVLCPPSALPDARGVRRRTIWFVVVGTGFAVVTEGLQQLAPVRRVADPYDVLADLLGLLAAVVAYGYLAQRRAHSPRD